MLDLDFYQKQRADFKKIKRADLFMFYEEINEFLALIDHDALQYLSDRSREANQSIAEWLALCFNTLYKFAIQPGEPHHGEFTDDELPF